jgi:ABC-type uncharacterized transport system substrate-binding protein
VQEIAGTLDPAAKRSARLPPAESVFARALRSLGYTWGQTIQIVCRSAEGNHRRLSEAAADLAAQKVDVIAALTHITAYAAHEATRSIPIVMIASGDPVATGLVTTLGRPGGNVTGLTYDATELVEKRLQLLKEMVPSAIRVGPLGNPESAHVFLCGPDSQGYAARRPARGARLEAHMGQPAYNGWR